MKPLIPLIACTALVCLFAAGPGAMASPLRIGIVPQYEVRQLQQIWQPLLDHLEKQTGEHFILVGSPTIPAFETEFLKGEFDFAYMNPFHLIMAHKKAGYLPLVRDVGRQLSGILVVSKSSGIGQVSALAGQTIAFPAPNALGASLQMRQELTDIFKLDFSPIYVKTHDSVYLNVLLGDAAAGGGVLSTLQQQQPEIRAQLKIIHQTAPVAPHPIAFHPRVPNRLVQKVKNALLDLGKTQAGKDLLSKIPITTIGQASFEDYHPLEAMDLERFYVKQE